MRSVKEKYIKSLKEKNKVISPHVGITQYNSFPSHAPCADPGKAQYS